jgi:hypothetical protein
MKNKLLIVSLVAIFLFSALNVAPAMAQCPTCNGTGKIVCPTCQGSGKITTSEQSETCQTCLGSGVVKPTIANKGTTAWASGEAAYVKGLFQNEEDAGVYGTATAEVQGSTTTYTNTSSSTYFPPHETIEITIVIEEISYSDYRYLTQQRYIRSRIYLSEVDEIICPDCSGTGVVSVAADCPECGGTGFVTCPTCGGSLIAGGGQEETATSFPLVEGAAVAVGVVAAVTMAAIVVVKRKRVSEEALRKLTPSEFQNWVVQKISGKVASQEDSRVGIDGYTAEGYPIQIKQSDDVGGNVIDNFASAMGRRKARNGIMVAFSFGKGVYEGVARAKIHYRLEIKTVTVKELIESREITSLWY